MKKRLISMLLMLSLLLSFLPTGLVSANTDTFDGYEYVFTSSVLKSELADEAYSGLSALAKLSNENGEIVDTTKSAPWKPAAHSYLLDAGTSLETDCFKMAFASSSTKESIAIKLDVEQGGTYIPELVYGAGYGTPIVDVYLIKEGTALHHHPGDTTAGFKFYDGYATDRFPYTGDDTEWNSINWYIRDSEGYGSYNVYTNDEDKLLVAKDLKMYSDNTGSFEGEKLVLEGNTTYFLLLVVTGQDTSDSAALRSEPEVHLKSFSLTPPVKDEISSLSLSASAFEMLVGEAVTLTATASYTISDSQILTDGITYESSDEDVAEVSENGVVTGKKKGKVTITATVDGTEISGSINLVVKEIKRATKELIYNFNRAALGSEVDINRTGLAELATKEGVIVDTEISDPWRPAAQSRSAGVTAEAECLSILTDREDTSSVFAIELDVEQGGVYIPRLEYNTDWDGPIVDVYLVEEGTESGGVSTDDFVFEDTYGTTGNLYSYTHHGNAYGIAAGAGKLILKTELDMCSEEKTSLAESFGNTELLLEENTKYYLIFVVTGRSSAWAVSNPTIRLKSFKLKPPVGKFGGAKLSVRGLVGEEDPMPNMTSRQLEMHLFDDVGIFFDEVDESKLSATYDSSDKAVATVSEDGIITAHSNGETKITAEITYDGITESAEYTLLVAPAGRNLMEHLNPDFSEDRWVWDSVRNDTVPENPPFFHTGIVTEPKDGDESNRAFAYTFNPEVPMPAVVEAIFLKRGVYRVQVEPGRLYQLTFKAKADFKKPENGEYPSVNYGIFAYNNPNGAASADVAAISGRQINMLGVEGWQETYNEWQEFVVPIVAPSNYKGEALYLSPRLTIGMPGASVGKTGYSGEIWMDDFELREVGFAGVEMEIQGVPTSDGGGSFNVIAKPYTTLGHYISIDGSAIQKCVEFSTSDEHIISGFRTPTVVESSGRAEAASVTATVGGKNGTAEIYATLTLDGISRTAKIPVTTAGYDMKLLYAEVKTNPASVEVGKSAQIEATGYMSDGTIADMTGGRIIYESLTPEIVSVNEDGVITTLRAGKGKIAATLILNSNSAYAEGEITVTDSSEIESAVLSGPETVGYLRDEPLILTGKMKSGYDADFTNADIKWIIGCHPEEFVKIIDNKFVFGNVKDKTTTISAEITLGGATVTTNEIKVTVGESDLRDFTVNFGGVNEKEFTDVTIEKYGWEMDVVNSHSSALTGYLYNDYVYALTNGVDHDFVVDFEVPYTGYFTPIFAGGMTDGYGAEKTYIYIDGAYVGDYEFYTEYLAPRNMRAVYLEAGVHKLTLRPAIENAASRNYYQYPASLRFAAIPSLPVAEKITTGKERYEIAKGNTASVSAKIKMSDGFIYEWQKTRSGEADPYVSVEYASGDDNTATVDDTGNITAVAVGETSVTVKVTINGAEVTKEIPVCVLQEGSITTEEVLDSVEIEAPHFVMNPEAEGIQLTVVGKNVEGAKLDMTGAEIIWETEDGSVISVSESGFATPVALGSEKVCATVTLNGTTKTGEVYVSVREGKVGRTYYSNEMVANARENITKYNWAKSESKSVIAAAEKYLGLEDKLWEMVPGEGIPRANTVGFRTDPNVIFCRYCGIDLLQNYGNYPWISNPLQRPWKIQCPDCKRLFPSNEFDKFYELGRDEHGIFNRELALQRHQEKFGGTYGVGYLKNTLYPEIGTEKSGVKLTGNETVEKWGVDDGFGYDTGRVYTNGTKEVHTYIAYYNHYGLWYKNGSDNSGTLGDAVDTLAEAYMFTGDEKYGRVGAILLDRIADVYPGYDIRPYYPSYANADGNSRSGKVIGSIWEVDLVRTFSKGYDAFFPMYDDSYVVSFLAEKAGTYNNAEINDKSTPEKIRNNIENGILRESFREVQNASLLGNFGAHQSALAQAAIVLDTHPDTDKMLDWLFAYSETDYSTYNTGGEINKRLINDVSRDGQGNESAPGYNRIWVTQTTEVAAVLAKYDEYEGVNLYENPKFVGMIKSYAPLTLVRRGIAPIADSGWTAAYSLLPDNDDVVINAFKETKDVEIAQHLYFIKNGNLDNLHYDIYTKNPESLSDDVDAIIEEYGEYSYDKNSLLTGYGFGALRAGTLHKSDGTVGIRDTQRDFWMYFGGAQSHAHSDKLGLGIEAWGLPMTTDLGYPETASKDPNRYQWQSATISHNTVVVNEKSQDTSRFSGTPLHYDEKDTRVKVMDIDASVVYAAADEYRRTVVMVDYDDEISYGIDFFKVLGGNDHLYSFHACSEEDPETSKNLSFKVQPVGSYAGAGVPYGPDPWSVTGNTEVVLKYPVGYSWLFNVKRADNPGTGEFYVDFKIKDFWKQSRNGKQDIRLRMTMVNDWAADEVTILDGMPPRTQNILQGINHLEYMLVRRKGRDLNTLFTTVVEPYDGSRYIKSIENVPVTVLEGTPGKNDIAKAVKVELVDGRIDYIVYAQNNAVTYNVGDLFEFCGFVGVWSTDENGVNIYSYVNDGEMIGNDTVKIENLDAAIEGTITDFQDKLSFDNWIEAELDRKLTQEEADELSGRIINVERDEPGNSTYVIESVDILEGTRARINLGGVTLIRGYVNAKKEDLGYNYDVAVGKTFDIPLSYEDNPAPVFDEVADDITTSAGSMVTVAVNATGNEGASVTYRARTLPRGASFNAETGTFTWKPDSSQIGDNLVAIDAVDEYGRITTQYFTVTVYGSTIGKPADKTEENTGNEGGSAGGGGGGGGGAAPDDKPEPGDDKTDAESGTSDETGNADTSGGTGETENVRFVDLGSHTWAEDAINTLAEDGIIKGTTASTFSPANNITRADFASLLVRAFKLESANAENFTDVSASDYFATELAIARNTGIINGIGDNKYAPRNTITRQDMMVIVHRALTTNPVGEGLRALPSTDEVLSQYPDSHTVAPYARDAVSALIGAGLVNGKSGRIAPTDYTTRAEVAVLIKRILDYMK